MYAETVADASGGATGIRDRISLPTVVISPVCKHTETREQGSLSSSDVDAVLFAFRQHRHVNNILTWLSDFDWLQVEEALRLALDPTTRCEKLSPLARDIVDLICTNQNVVKRILRPYFENLPHETPTVERLLNTLDHFFQDDDFVGRSTPFVICDATTVGIQVDPPMSAMESPPALL